MHAIQLYLHRDRSPSTRVYFVASKAAKQPRQRDKNPLVLILIAAFLLHITIKR